MRRSKLWPRIWVDGDVFVEGFLSLTWAPSEKAEQARKRWQDSVDKILSALAKKHTSWAVMTALHKSGKKVTIVPNPVLDCNARAVPESKQDAARRNTEAETCDESESGSSLGTGKGTATEITFSPGQFASGGTCSVGGAGRDADEVLFHELCHAMRYGTGQRNACFASFAGFRGYEEFVAVLLTNVFSSETRRTLRRDHEGYNQMPKTSRLLDDRGNRIVRNLNDPKVFYGWAELQIKNLAKYHKTMTDYLRRQKHIKWNPFVYS